MSSLTSNTTTAWRVAPLEPWRYGLPETRKEAGIFSVCRPVAASTGHTAHLFPCLKQSSSVCTHLPRKAKRPKDLGSPGVTEHHLMMTRMMKMMTMMMTTMIRQRTQRATMTNRQTMTMHFLDQIPPWVRENINLFQGGATVPHDTLGNRLARLDRSRARRLRREGQPRAAGPVASDHRLTQEETHLLTAPRPRPAEGLEENRDPPDWLINAVDQARAKQPKEWPPGETPWPQAPVTP